MAGIGYELKKIFKEESISRLAGGIAYSTIVTIGPTIVVIGTIVALYIILGFLSVPYYDRELLSSTILYGFIFSLLVTAPFNGVMSRYIADKIYEEKYDDILPSFYTGIFFSVLLGSIIGIPFVYRLIFIGNVDPVFAFVSYGFFIALIITFFSMIYLSATKDYKFIAIFYNVGMVITFCMAILFKYLGLSIIEAILYGLTIGFLIISILEFSYMKKYFKNNSKNYGDCLSYFKEHSDILISNLFYVLGMYIHNFVFWTHPSRIIIAKSYISMQSYDMASFLAMFTNISTIIIFTVMVETKFHTKYQEYNEAVIGRTWHEIEMTKISMFKLLTDQISYIVNIQFRITGTIFLIGTLLLPRFGFGGSILLMYTSLVPTFLVIFLMYSNIVFMFYFNHNKSAQNTSLIFCICVFLGSIVSLRLRESFYGLGPFVGAFIGWTYSYFRIKYIERNFDEHIFCKVDIIEQKKQEAPSNIAYRRSQIE